MENISLHVDDFWFTDPTKTIFFFLIKRYSIFDSKFIHVPKMGLPSIQKAFKFINNSISLFLFFFWMHKKNCYGGGTGVFVMMKIMMYFKMCFK